MSRGIVKMQVTSTVEQELPSFITEYLDKTLAGLYDVFDGVGIVDGRLEIHFPRSGESLREEAPVIVWHPK